MIIFTITESIVLAVLFAVLFHFVRLVRKLARVRPLVREAQHRLLYMAFLEGELQRMRYRGAHSRPIGYAAMLELEQVRADARHAAAIGCLHAAI